MTTRVLVVDDSATVRSVLSHLLNRDPDIEVVGTAPDPFVARDLIVQHRPDIITLDLEMPRMDGLEFLRKLMASHPLPVIVVSSLTPKNSPLALEALSLGALDVVCKTSAAHSVEGLGLELVERVKALARARVTPPTNLRASSAPLKLGQTTTQLVAIGASTGGTRALETVLTRLPANAPPILVVQHMPADFTGPFAERLNQLCKIRVKEAEPRDAVTSGTCLIAPGGRHMTLSKSGALYQVGFSDAAPVCFCRPSVDVLFESVARAAGKNALGIILTGMGRDGAEGLLKMRQAGARTATQDEATSVVYGMPKAAFDHGASETVLPLQKIPDRILQFASAGAPA